MALDQYGILLQVKSQLGTAEKDLNRVQNSAMDLTKQFGKTIIGVASLTSAMIVLKKELSDAYMKSVKFAEGLANVGTLIPGQTARLNELKTSIKELSTNTGKSLSDLTEGLYQTISAFGDASDTEEKLNVVTKAGVAGRATTIDSLNLLSAVTKAYGDTSAVALAKISDLAFETVRLGQTTFPELASSIQNVTDTSNRLGVSQEELFNSFATLTGVTGNANIVSTQLRSAMLSLEGPSEDLKKLYDELGISSGKAMIQQYGLQGSFELIRQYAEDTGTPIQDLLGRIEAVAAVSAIAGSQAETYANKLAQIQNATGATDKAFKEFTEGINTNGFAVEKLKATWDVFQTQVGDTISPFIGAIASGLNSLLTVFTSNERGTENLANKTAELSKISADYDTVVKQLKNSTSELTDEEIILLNVRKETYEQEINAQYADLIDTYADATMELETLGKALSSAQMQQKAYSLVLSDEIGAQQEVDRLRKKSFLSKEEEIYLLNLERGLINDVRITQEDYLDAVKMVGDYMPAYNELNHRQNVQINAIAQAYNKGLIPIELYKNANIDLYNAIIEASNAMKNQKEDVVVTTSSLNSQAVLDSFIGFTSKQLRSQLEEYQRQLDFLKKFGPAQITSGEENAKYESDVAFYSQIIEGIKTRIAKTEVDIVASSKKDLENKIAQLQVTDGMKSIELERTTAIKSITDELGNQTELIKLVNTLYDMQGKIFKDNYEKQIDDQLFAINNENQILAIEHEREKAQQDLIDKGLNTAENIAKINSLYEAQKRITIETAKEQWESNILSVSNLSEHERLEKEKAIAIAKANKEYGDQADIIKLINEYYDIMMEKTEEEVSLLDEFQNEMKKLMSPSDIALLTKFQNGIAKIGKLFSDLSPIINSVTSAFESYYDLQFALAEREIDILEETAETQRNLADEQLDALSETYDERMSALQEMYDADAISYEEYMARKLAIDTNYNKDKENAEKDALLAEKAVKQKQYEADLAEFEYRKKMAISNAVISAGQGIMSAWALGPIAGIIGSGIIASALAYQISQINSQPKPQPPKLAEGGIVTSPTLAMIGEGGEPEAVVPLSKSSSFGFGENKNSSMQYNISGNTFVGIGGVDELVRLLEERKAIMQRKNLL